MMLANTPRFSCPYDYDAMNFMASLAIMILIATSRTRLREIFKRLSQDEGRADFSKISATLSLLNIYQNEPKFQPDPSRLTVPLTVYRKIFVCLKPYVISNLFV